MLTKVFGTNKEWNASAEWAKLYENAFRAEDLNVAIEE